jgi:hypothetical protein
MDVQRLFALVNDRTGCRIDHLLAIPISKPFALHARGNESDCAISLFDHSAEDPLKPALCFAQAGFEAFAVNGNNVFDSTAISFLWVFGISSDLTILTSPSARSRLGGGWLQS